MRVQKLVARVLVPIGAAIVALPLTAAPARAQDVPLAQVLPDLILGEIVLQRGLVGPAHVAHFSPFINEPNNPVVEKALASGTANGLETALRGSQWAIERIAQDGARVIDPPNGAPSSGPRILVDVAVGGIEPAMTENPLPPTERENT